MAVDPKAASNPTQIDPTAAEALRQQLGVQSELNFPSPPGRYANLHVGPDLTVGYEPNTALSVDGSDALLRGLSPFVLQVEPPLVIGSEPFVQTKNKPPTGLYRAAAVARNGFSNARVALAAPTFVQSNVRGSDATEEVPEGGAKSSGGTRNKSGDGTQSVTAGGHVAGKLGEPAISDLRAATDIFFQLQAVLQTPPLVLLINPQSLSISYTKIQQFSDRTRTGYVFHAWGEEQPKMSIEARCGAFISGGKGVQVASKRDSAAWQNLMTAFHLYRNNGYIYDTVGQSLANHFIGALSIRYDQWIYYGHMESFSWTYEEGNQFGGVTFGMEFSISSMMDTAPVPLNIQPMRRSLGGLPPSGVNDPAFNPPNEGSLITPNVSTGGSLLSGLVGGADSAKTPRRTGAPSVPPSRGGFRSPGPAAGPVSAQAAPTTNVEPFRGLA